MRRTPGRMMSIQSNLIKIKIKDFGEFNIDPLKNIEDLIELTGENPNDYIGVKKDNTVIRKEGNIGEYLQDGDEVELI